MELRPYQNEARDAVFREWSEGRKRTLLVQATGTGKTIVFSKIAETAVANGDRVLILAHRDELLQQARAKLSASCGLACSIEKADSHSVKEWERITVGSVQTMMREKRLKEFEHQHFDVIVIDEAHHALSKSYQNVLNWFPDSYVLGVTATPDRGDKKDLGQFFQSIAYEYPLAKAIKEGFLCRIHAQTIPIDIDLRGCSMSAGDYKASDVGNALDPYLEAIADEMVERCKDRKTVVFLPLIATSQKFCQMLNERGFRAAEVNGQSDDRKEILAAFDSGTYNVLCNSMLLTEGWDCPSVDCIVNLRPTKIRGLYCQIVGRGTRLYPGKDHLLLLDFLWQTSRHNLCRPASLLCKTEEVAEKMTEILEGGAEMDVEEAAEEAASDVVTEREEALAKQLEEMRKKKGRLIDPIQYGMSLSEEDLIDYEPTFEWEFMPPSEKQLSALGELDVDPERVPNAGYASVLLDRIKTRRENGMSSPKQIRLLERKGFRHVGDWTMSDASKLIGQIAANGWKTPNGIIPSQYKPVAAQPEPDWPDFMPVQEESEQVGFKL